MTQKVYQELAVAFDALQNCKESGNEEWEVKHSVRIERLIDDHFPHGSGFDSGCTFDFERSRRNRLIVNTSYHHMDESGFYTGWTEHDVIITPDLAGEYNLRITGRNTADDIKGYIAECFSITLHETVD